MKKVYLLGLLSLFLIPPVSLARAVETSVSEEKGSVFVWVISIVILVLIVGGVRMLKKKK